MGPHETWRDQLLNCIKVIKSLPSQVISENPVEYRNLVDEMTSELTKFRSMAESLLEPTHETP